MPRKGGKTMHKIPMAHPIVEMDGDEMTRILWRQIRQELLEPFVELEHRVLRPGSQTPRRDGRPGDGRGGARPPLQLRRGGQVRHHHAQRAARGGIRSQGRCGRAPTAPSAPCWMARCSARRFWSAGIQPAVRTWKKPITIARHAYGDVYKATRNPTCPARARRS